MRIPARLLMTCLFVSGLILSTGATGRPRLPLPTVVDSIAVAKVVGEFHAALSTGDGAKASRLLAPDAVILESGGIETRAEYIADHLPADIEFAKAVRSGRGDLLVTVDGTSAWTAASSTTHGRFKDREINSIGAESMVLTKRDGAWRIRSIHWSSRKGT